MMGCSLPCFDTVHVPDGVTACRYSWEGAAGALPLSKGASEAVGEGLWAPVAGGAARP